MEVEACWRPGYFGRSPVEQDRRMASTSPRTSPICRCRARTSSFKAMSRRISGFAMVEKQVPLPAPAFAVLPDLGEDCLEPGALFRREGLPPGIRSASYLLKRLLDCLVPVELEAASPQVILGCGGHTFFESIPVPDDKLTSPGVYPPGRAGEQPRRPAAKYKTGEGD